MMLRDMWCGGRRSGCVGAPHVLLVLSDVGAALREEERLAWRRLIRVLGHEINNSLTPIKSIAGSLRGRLPESVESAPNLNRDLQRGLAIIEDRAASLNRVSAGLSAVVEPACAAAGVGFVAAGDGAGCVAGAEDRGAD